MKIDLHMHTINSDGSDTTEELIEKLLNLKADIVSITDHDNLKAYADLKKIKNKTEKTLNIIRGVELSCVHEGNLKDILAFDFDEKIMNSFLLEKYAPAILLKKQQDILNKFYYILKEKGFIIDDNLKVTVGKKAAAYYVAYNSILKYPENLERFPFIKDASFFYWNYFINQNSDYYVGEIDNNHPTMEEVIDTIHKSGGLAFLAHPFIYSGTTETAKNLLNFALNCGIDGIEARHCVNSAAQTKFLLKYAKQHNLLVCGGSDYHGTNKPAVYLIKGTDNNVAVKFKDIAPWFDKVKKIIF